MTGTVSLICPVCGGALVGSPAKGVPFIPETHPDDWVWQCQGKCTAIITPVPINKVYEEYAAAFSGKKK